MSELTPTNSLEIRLRSLILDKTTPYWSFLTPLAGVQVFIIAAAVSLLGAISAWWIRVDKQDNIPKEMAMME